MVKLVCISDTHFEHYYLKLPKGDILIHCGDFSFRGETIERYLVNKWLARISKKYAYVVFIAGNHDIGMTPETTLALRRGYTNLIHLHDNPYKLEGINFYGSAYTPRFGDWGFGETEDQLANRFNHIHKATDILITHGPPYSILDLNQEGINCGSKSLYQKVKELPNLKYHFFGHIHEGYGHEKIDNINFYNCSVLNRQYEIANKPWVINYEG